MVNSWCFLDNSSTLLRSLSFQQMRNATAFHVTTTLGIYYVHPLFVSPYPSPSSPTQILTDFHSFFEKIPVTVKCYQWDQQMMTTKITTQYFLFWVLSCCYSFSNMQLPITNSTHISTYASQ